MPKQQRRRAKYPGVYYFLEIGANGRPERVYSICYRKEGKQVDEIAGGQFQDNMTPEGAGHLRMMRLNGDASTNRRVGNSFWQTQELGPSTASGKHTRLTTQGSRGWD